MTLLRRADGWVMADDVYYADRVNIDFDTWFQRRLEAFKAIEGLDYVWGADGHLRLSEEASKRILGIRGGARSRQLVSYHFGGHTPPVRSLELMTEGYPEYIVKSDLVRLREWIMKQPEADQRWVKARWAAYDEACGEKDWRNEYKSLTDLRNYYTL